MLRNDDVVCALVNTGRFLGRAGRCDDRSRM